MDQKRSVHRDGVKVCLARGDCWRLSLSVEIANPALNLYRRHGYREVTRAGATCTMVLDLDLST
jgi:hypothetical protein